MTRMTEAKGRQLIQDYERSGLEPAPFCVQQNIRYHTLTYWRQRLRLTDKNKKKNSDPKPALKTGSSAFVHLVAEAEATNNAPTNNQQHHGDFGLAGAAAVIVFPNHIRIAIGAAHFNSELMKTLAQC